MDNDTSIEEHDDEAENSDSKQCNKLVIDKLLQNKYLISYLKMQCSSKLPLPAETPKKLLCTQDTPLFAAVQLNEVYQRVMLMKEKHADVIHRQGHNNDEFEHVLGHMLFFTLKCKQDIYKLRFSRNMRNSRYGALIGPNAPSGEAFIDFFTALFPNIEPRVLTLVRSFMSGRIQRAVAVFTRRCNPGAIRLPYEKKISTSFMYFFSGLTRLGKTIPLEILAYVRPPQSLVENERKSESRPLIKRKITENESSNENEDREFYTLCLKAKKLAITPETPASRS